MSILDENASIFGATLMLTAMINALISHSVTLTENDIIPNSFKTYAFMFKIVFNTIEMEGSP